MGVLMVARTEAAASAATLALQKALPATCRPCFLAFKVLPSLHLYLTSTHSSPNSAGHKSWMMTRLAPALSSFALYSPGPQI